MSNTIELKNAKISFSTMLNKLDKKLYGRMFKVMVPVDSPELAQTIEQYKKLNELAKKTYGEKLGKKLKNAKSTEDVFAESTYKEGFVELKFNIVYIRTKEEEQEDGSTKEVLKEVLNPIYKNLDFIYRINNNGNKEYMIEGTEKHWVPCSDNTVNLKYSLVAGYSEKNNQPTIQLKADAVEIVDSNFGSKSSKSKYEMLSLSSEDDEIATEVENVKPTPVKPSTPKQEDELFTASELASLDI